MIGRVIDIIEFSLSGISTIETQLIRKKVILVVLLTIFT